MPDEPQGSPPPGGWLPPDTPGGPAPGGGAPGQPPPSQGPPPAWGQPPGQYQQPPGQYPPGQYQQSPQWGQYGQQYPYQQPSPWASTYYWQQAEPDNSPAVAGFVMSLVSIGTLVMFFGFLSPLNLAASIAATFVSRNGIKKVERGETTKNKDLAKWGFWLGIAGAVLSALVILGFVLLITSDPSWLEPDSTEPR